MGRENGGRQAVTGQNRSCGCCRRSQASEREVPCCQVSWRLLQNSTSLLATSNPSEEVDRFHNANKGTTRYLDRNCHLFQSVCQHFFLVIRTWWVDVEPSIVKYAAPATVRPAWPLWFPSIWRVASHILVSLSLCFAIWGNRPLRTLQLDDEAIFRAC